MGLYKILKLLLSIENYQQNKGNQPIDLGEKSLPTMLQTNIEYLKHYKN